MCDNMNEQDLSTAKEADKVLDENGIEHAPCLNK